MTMEYDYNDIVHRWYEEIKPLFINFLRKNFPLDYDRIMDIYEDIWIDVRENILTGRVEPGTKWKAYILKMGFFQACKVLHRDSPMPSIDDEKFNYDQFIEDFQANQDAERTLYNDPEMQEILASELSYIPDPCNKVLRLYFYDQFSTKEIADTMNYSGPKVACITKNRCIEKLRNRVMSAANKLGIIG